MPIQKVEYEFPDPDKVDAAAEIEVEAPEKTMDIEVEGAVGREEIKSTPQEKKPEVEIEVVDDTPERDKGKVPSTNFKEVDDEELESYSKSVKKRIGQLNKATHDERRAKEAAERQLAELTRISKPLFEENKELKSRVDRSQEAMLKQAKVAVEAEMLAAKRQYKDAYESGDTDAIVAAQEAITTAKIRDDKVTNFKRQPLQTPENDIKVPQNNVEPAQPTKDPRAQDWAEKNTWFGSDDEMTAFALGLDSKLKKNGIDPRSEEYYEKINSRMREVFPSNFDGDGEQPSAQRKQSNVVAPATRSTKPNKVTLSQTQVALAKRLGVPLEDYAKQAAELMREQK